MGLFKSGEDSRTVSNFKLKQLTSSIRREISECDKRVSNFIQYARRALQAGDTANYNLSRHALKQTLAAKRLRERQLLHLEIAISIKDQTEADMNFAKGMKEVSNAIQSLCQNVNMLEIQIGYDKALACSEMLKKETEKLLDKASKNFMQKHDAAVTELVTDKEVDELLAVPRTAPENEDIDSLIEKQIKDIQKNLEPNE